MASHGIKDKVAIVGMGCTKFGEHWDQGPDDLLIDAAGEAFASAGIDKEAVDAYWLGTAISGSSGMTLARPLQLHGKPVSRVENFCATGAEALRNAAYAVASGAYDVAMAIGVEKVKDSGYQGLVGGVKVPSDGTGRTLTAAAMFAMCVPAYGKKLRRDRRADARSARPHLAEEPLQRRTQPARAVPARGLDRDDLQRAAHGRRAPRVRLLGRRRRLRRGDPRARRRRAPLHRQAALHQGPVVRRRQLLGQRRSRLRLHVVPRDRRVRAGRVRAGGHHRPAQTRSRWPRCTTASRRPSC